MALVDTEPGGGGMSDFCHRCDDAPATWGGILCDRCREAA